MSKIVQITARPSLSARGRGRLSSALPRHAWVVALSLMAATTSLLAQTGGRCVPVSERGSSGLGCFVTAREALGKLPSTPLFWHLDTYPNRAAAEAARVSGGTVVESFGKIWLFTIADANWRPLSGTRVSQIGPLPLVAAESYAAVYMEGSFEPGMASEVHRHPGAEAWFTLVGAMCVETPNGKISQAAGDPGVFVAGGLPMELIGTGTGVRHSLVLILQDASKPSGSAAPDWKPKGLCRG
jgi:hypothetical protein